ncbi:hypothetical protein [Congregibacter litoralis]|uniref:Uncharacterized protein n=1 Tax=Congregibacter litoralis KT71 TaxID=314285 RepID=A4A864_9GAMM|nr:hypothetical protein [Congregibacter litoralis]EAQ96336.1 hypothetical protein KT71_13155 [Congregibacter litoralis KT71]EAQ97859.1 hypothetical protein KT71_14879 [Congregibacter litoralis KT71]
MLLRRVTEHVRNQNWFAVGIDFCIVVIGVYIGIQVANWNSSRLTQQEESVLVSRLLAEFKELEGKLNQNLLTYKKDKEILQELINEVSGGVSEQEALTVAERSLGISLLSPAISTPAYRELLSTGKINIIQSQALKRALRDWGIQADRLDIATPVILDYLFLHGAPLHDVTNAARNGGFAEGSLFKSQLSSQVESLELYLGALNCLRGVELLLDWQTVTLERAAEVIMAAEQYSRSIEPE